MNKRNLGLMRVLILGIVLVLALTACSKKDPGESTTAPSKVDPVYIENVDGSERHALQSGQYLAADSNTPVDTQPSKGYAYYNEGTLYLNNYANDKAAFVFGTDQLTIHLLGKNTIGTVSDNAGGRITELPASKSSSLVITAGKGATLTMSPAAEGAVAISVSGSVQVSGGDITVKAPKAADDAIRCKNLVVAGNCLALVSKDAAFKNLAVWDGSAPVEDYSCFMFSDNALPAETTLVKICGVWCYVEKGQLSTATTLVKYNDNWWYVSGGTVNTANTLCKFNGKWYHVNEGQWVKDTTLVKFNKAWWYVKDGILNTDNTLVKYNGKWFHVNEGQWVKDTTLVKYNKAWFYVKDGIVNTDNTLCKFNGKWFHVNEGKWVKDNALVQYGKQWYYVAGGIVDFTYNGEFEYNGEVHTITNGIKE